MKRIGTRPRWILSVLFCLASQVLTLVPSPQIQMAQGASALDRALDALPTVERIINALPDSAFENRNNRNALLKRIDATFAQLETGAYLAAIKTLKGDIEDKLSQWILVSQQAALIDALETTIASVICAEVDGM